MLVGIRWTDRKRPGKQVLDERWVEVTTCKALEYKAQQLGSRFSRAVCVEYLFIHGDKIQDFPDWEDYTCYSGAFEE